MYNLENFEKVKVLVIGDVMIDKYLWGEVRRISPEAPVPIVNLKNQTAVAGGAANVAANIAALGAKPYLFGVVGKDSDGESFGEILKKSNVSAKYLFGISNRQTTVKTRIMAHNQQIARLDQETISELTLGEEQKLFAKIKKFEKIINIIIVSDYGKGLLSKSLLEKVLEFAQLNDIPVMVDPKGRDYGKYKGATLLTPNKFELAEVCGEDAESYTKLEGSALKLLQNLDLKFLVVTRGEDGITLFKKDEKPETIKALKRKVYDVTGAGDTFISALAVAYAAGNDIQAACKIANTAAGLVVEELGTTTLNLKNLWNSLGKS